MDVVVYVVTMLRRYGDGVCYYHYCEWCCGDVVMVCVIIIVVNGVVVDVVNSVGVRVMDADGDVVEGSVNGEVVLYVVVLLVVDVTWSCGGYWVIVDVSDVESMGRNCDVKAMYVVDGDGIVCLWMVLISDVGAMMVML